MKPDKALTPRLIFDERNLARLGVVSIQTRLQASHDRWKHEFTVEGRQIKIEGNAPEGRPCGVDTNLLLGIESLFAEQGFPEDNWLHTTAYQLREASFLPNNGQNYKRLRESINRIYAVYFRVAQGWVGSTLRHNETIRILDRMAYWDKGDTDSIRELVPTATLSLKLADQFADSIRSGFTQALEHKLLVDCEQPPARALYRVLEAHRYTDKGVQLAEITVNLEDWRKACGVSQNPPNKVLRAFKEAHEELIAQNYLQSVTTGGPSRAPVMTYIFRRHDAPDPALVQLLLGYRVSSAMANKLAKEAPERIEDGIKFVEYRKTTPKGVRDEAALLVDFIQTVDKYQLPETREAITEKYGVRVQAARAAQESETVRAAQEFEMRRAAERTLPAREQWTASRQELKTLVGKKLSAPQWATLQERCLSGQLQAAQLRDEVVRAMGQVTLGEYIEALKERLDAP